VGRLSATEHGNSGLAARGPETCTVKGLPVWQIDATYEADEGQLGIAGVDLAQKGLNSSAASVLIFAVETPIERKLHHRPQLLYVSGHVESHTHT
jgi:hypothetical protein